jgi:hypothetical protein
MAAHTFKIDLSVKIEQNNYSHVMSNTFDGRLKPSLNAAPDILGKRD